MNWQEFITELLEHDLKISSIEAEYKTGIRQPVFDRWKRSLTKAPQMSSIRKLEEAFNIEIDIRDPKNIKYKKKENKINTNNNGEENKIGTATYINVVDRIEKGSTMGLFAYKIKATDISDIYETNTVIIYSTIEEVKNNDVAIIKLKDGKILIKKCIIKGQNIFTYTNNENNDIKIDLIEPNDLECYYKVAGSVDLTILG